jgi:hypothetical protein
MEEKGKKISHVTYVITVSADNTVRYYKCWTIVN